MTEPSADTRFRNARLPDGRTVDIVVRDGRFAGLEAPSPGPGTDLAGKLVIPALVDGHVHLDKTFLGLPWRPHRAGPSVADRIAAEREGRAALDMSVEERARTFLARMVSFGTVATRSHVDVDPDCELDHLHQVLAARAAFAGVVDVQLVAFPQSGVVTAPGVEDLLDAALRAGADLIGGVDPQGIDGDIDGQLDVIFRLAERHGVGVDIHLHDPGHRGDVPQFQRAGDRGADPGGAAARGRRAGVRRLRQRAGRLVALRQWRHAGAGDARGLPRRSADR
jgi:cytosine deaminase